uniref:Uncharacterized protein n=1 Tax=Arundo donax TaxID=35708 RepID=A0A0A9HAV6_ARUDO
MFIYYHILPHILLVTYWSQQNTKDSFDTAFMS